MTESKTKPQVSASQAGTPEVVVNSAPAQPAPVYYVQNPPEKKGGFSFGKCCLFGCIALILCCICTAVFAAVAPNVLITAVVGGNKPPDATLTRVTSLQEYTTLDSAITAKLEKEVTTDPATGNLMISLNEKEAIAFLFYSLGLDTLEKPLADKDFSKLGVKFTPGNAKIQIDLSLIFAILPPSEGQSFDPKSFEGVNISVDLGTSADNKTIQIKDFSTGNTLIDSVMGGFKQQLITSFEESFSDSASSQGPSGIEKVTFKEGTVELVVSGDSSQP
jgi:hypothetical protein